MSNIETIRDLVTEGLASHGEVRALAKALYSEPVEHLAADIVGFSGYTIMLPDFDSLPDHVQAFIIKSLYDSRAINFLTKKAEELADEEAAIADGIIGDDFDE